MQGRWQDAISVYNDVTRVFLAKYGETNDNLAVLLNLKGKAFYVGNKFHESLDSYEKGIVVRTAYHGPDYSTLAELHTGAGRAHARLNEPKIAFKCYTEALRIQQIALTNTHLDLIPTITSLAELSSDPLKDVDKALRFW